VHGNGREVGQNEEELEGNRFRSLPWAGVLWRGGSTTSGGAARGGGRGDTGGGDGGLGKEGKSVVEVRSEVGSRSGPFIGTEGRFGEDILSFAELQWPTMEVREKSRRGLLPAGFLVDWLLCELTRRAGLLWPWRGDRRGSNGGRFVGDSSLPGLRLSGRGGRCRPAAGAGLKGSRQYGLEGGE
jgi:hypothetical protein